MERVSWKQRMKNTIVLKKVGTKRQLLAIIKERKLKYFGHIKRSNSIQKFILEGKVEGKRGVGRRRTSWIKNIKTDSNLELEECNVLAKDRDGWRELTKAVTFNLQDGEETR